jgi:gliding motility-associated-like protein
VVTANPAATITYTVTGTTSGCDGTATSTVTVNALPVVTVNSGTMCPSGSVTLTANGAATYSWTPSTGLSATTGSVVTANPAATTTYTVTGTTSGCDGAATSTVTVYPLPTVVIGSNSPVCEGGTLNLTSSGGVSYLWAGPGTPAFTSALQNPTILPVTSAMAGNYTVTVQDAHGCYNANVTNVVVNPQPAIPVGSGGPYCLNATALPLSASASAGGTLNWYGTSPGGAPSSAATVPSTTIAGTTVYYVSQTIAGCESNKGTISVLVNPLPTGTLNAIAPACVPLTDQFIISPGTGISSYVWNMGNGTLNSTGNTITHTYEESGVYSISVTLTDGNGCSAVLSFPNAVHVNEVPVAAFAWSPEVVSILDPTVTFYSYSAPSTNSFSWNIYQQNNLLYSTTDIQPSYVFPEVDTFNVELTVVSVDGCTSTSTKPLIIQDEYAVYIPNAFSPDGDYINEEFKVVGVGIAKVEMSIFNRWGEVIFSTTEMDKGWNGKDSKNNRVENGVYIYKASITDKQGVKSMKTGHVTVVR